MTTVFISDLHLSMQAEHLLAKFDEFITQHCRDVTALYILGDLFDICYGPDPDDCCYDYVSSRLARLAENNTQICFIAGNRDFCLPRNFIRDSRLTILKEPYCLALNDTPTLLGHGDNFCREDKQYLRYRRIIRNPIMLGFFRLLPLHLRRRIAATIKSQSVHPPRWIDVTPSHISELMDSFAVTQVIHGHTHIPTIAMDTSTTPARRRICLSDWGEHGNYLKVGKDATELVYF